MRVPRLPDRLPTLVPLTTSYWISDRPLLRGVRRTPGPGSGTPGPDEVSGCCRSGSRPPVPSWLRQRQRRPLGGPLHTSPCATPFHEDVVGAPPLPIHAGLHLMVLKDLGKLPTSTGPKSGLAGIKAMEFASGVLGSEPPVNGGPCRVPLRHAGVDCSIEAVPVGIAAAQAGTRQHAELDLRHIQPTPVLGSVVELQPLGNAPGLSRRKGLIQ